MTPSKMIFAMAIGLSAAACSTYTTTTAVAPAPVVSGSQQACVDYGFTPGTGAYDRCVSREHEARLRGRVAVGYADAQLAEDARAACYSYGLEPATPRYDRCVGREIDARRYRDSTTTVYVPAAGTTTTYTTVYTPPAAPPPTPYVETRNSNTAGVQAFRDEYGFRYDAEGNRLDRNGNIISPQSTQP